MNAATRRNPAYGGDDRRMNMRFAVAVGRKLLIATGWTNERLEADPFVQWVASLFELRTREVRRERDQARIERDEYRATAETLVRELDMLVRDGARS